jgi:hypothetical protein
VLKSGKIAGVTNQEYALGSALRCYGIKVERGIEVASGVRVKGARELRLKGAAQKG